MSSFPTNYVYNNGVTDVMYFPGLTEMAMQFGTLGFSPYQSAIATVAQIALVNSATATIRNTAQGELLSSKSPNYNFPLQMAYTTDVTRMKDRFILKLYSPRTNRNEINPFESVGGLIKDIGIVAGDVSGITSLGTSLINKIPGAGMVGLIYEGVKGNIGDVANMFGDKVASAAAKQTSLTSGRMMDYLENGQEAFYEKTESGASDPNNVLANTHGKYYYTEIILPMPQEQIVDSHSHTIGGAQLSPIQMGLNIAESAVNFFVNQRREKDTSNKKDLRNFNPNTTDIVGYLKNYASAKTRLAINPMAENLYQSPVARQWQFTFNYIPTNKNDYDTFIQMIEKIKQHSYPTLTADELLYNFPGTCDFFMSINNGKFEETSGGTLPHNKKPCFISDVQISYLNGTGTYTHFWDGNPTSIVLTITLIESQLLTREDFLDKKTRQEIEDGTYVPTPVEEPLPHMTAHESMLG